MHLRILHIFFGLIDHFLLVIENISLSGYTTVYLSIHLLKNILIAFFPNDVWYWALFYMLTCYLYIFVEVFI